MPQKLQLLIIHCTATPEGREVSGKQIWAEHTAPVAQGGRGWSRPGYADVIHLGGTVENLVPHDEDPYVREEEITNGVAGYNGISRHVAYIGGMDADMKAPKDTRTPAQKQALANYVKQVIASHPDIKVAGHRQFANKACPSFDTVPWLRAIGVEEKNIYVN